MAAEDTKLNTRNTLEAFRRFVAGGTHSVRLTRIIRIPTGITFRQIPGIPVKIPVLQEKVFRVPSFKGTCSAEGLKFPEAEQEQARTLARVNTPEQFRAFVRAARGKVRPSVRWKLKRRRVASAYIAFVKGFTPFSPSGWPAVMKSFRLALARNRSRLAHKARPDRLYRFSKRWLTVDRGTERRVTQDPRGYFQLIRKYHDSIRQAEQSRALWRSVQDDWRFLPDEGDWEDFSDETAEDFTRSCPSDWDTRRERVESAYIVGEYHFSPKYQEGVGDWANVALMERSAVRELLGQIKRPAFILLFLRKVLALIYRVQTVRRAGPPVRRLRFSIPRPPELLPLPPSAPLAPPA